MYKTKYFYNLNEEKIASEIFETVYIYVNKLRLYF